MASKIPYLSQNFLQQQEGRQPSEMASQSESMPLIESVDHWEFPRARLRLTTVIGDGAFGTVMRGVARGIRSSCENEIVAVKIVRGKNAPLMLSTRSLGCDCLGESMY